MVDRLSFPIPERPPSGAQEIFSHLTDSIDRRQPKRPLGPVSNFVTDQLPYCIAEIKASKRPDQAVKALWRSTNAMIAATDCEAQLLGLPQSEFEIAKTDVEYLVNCAYQISAFAGLQPVDAELTVGRRLAVLHA